MLTSAEYRFSVHKMNSMPDSTMQVWASRFELTSSTLQVLTAQGFTSLSLLQHLSTDDVTESFQKPGVLPLAQCIALKKALQQIGVESGAHAATTGGFAEPLSQPSYPSFPPGSYPGTCGPYGMPTPQPSHPPSSYPGSLGNPGMPTPQPSHPLGLYPSPYGSPAVQTSQPSRPSNSFPHEKGGKEMRFLLLGKTGSGKSTTGNSVLGASMFPVGAHFESVTYECALRRNQFLGRQIEIMDSPGLFDTKRTHEQISIDIIKSVITMHPGPHAILYVIPIGRYTDEEYKVYTRLKALFDEHLTRYLIVLFTGGDRIGPGETIDSMLRKVPEGLAKVLQECGHRYVLFNNMAADKRPYVEQLFQLIDRMIQANGGQPYTCPKYSAVGEGLEAEVERRLAEVEQQDLERTKYVQHLQRETEAAQQAVEKERENFQRKEVAREQEIQREQERRDKEMRDMQEVMKQQNLSLEKQREEECKLREQMEKERTEQLKAMQEQRERDLAELREREEKMEKWLTEQREENRRRQEERDRQHAEMMRQVKDSAASSGNGGGGGGIVESLVGGLMSFVMSKYIPFLKF